MRHSALLLLLALATVMIAACQQKRPQVAQAPRQNQNPQAGRGSQENHGPQLHQGPEASDDSNPGDELPAAAESQPADDPPVEPGTNAGDQPPLLLDDEPLLLLDDDGEFSAALAGPVADNSRCHHCHLNYVDEELAVVHARANIGCADCHGNCDEHIADESWASGGNGTPPELMYPLEKINRFCLDCHPSDKIDQEEHDSLLAGAGEEKYCTDCHGDHRLADRKCKWK